MLGLVWCYKLIKFLNLKPIQVTIVLKNQIASKCYVFIGNSLLFEEILLGIEMRDINLSVCCVVPFSSCRMKECRIKKGWFFNITICIWIHCHLNVWCKIHFFLIILQSCTLFNKCFEPFSWQRLWYAMFPETLTNC